VFFIILLGCAAKPSPVQSYLSGGQAEAIAAQKYRAAQDDADQALNQVRLASMAYATGDARTAEIALRGAVGHMTTFRADGEFRATVGAESSKDWKGEPYEKMAAFLMLGTLLHAQGDRGNALAMYKSSVLADTGTAAERYRSDFVPGWIMQALAYQAEGEHENARQFMQRGIDARWSRRTLDLTSEALVAVRVEGLGEEQHTLAKVILFAALSGGVTAAPRDPGEAARATQSIASDLILSQQALPARQRLPALQPLSKADFHTAAEALPAVVEPWRERCAAMPAEMWADEVRFAERMTALLAAAPNTILLVERGHAPQKQRLGRYGQLLQIVPDSRSAHPPAVLIDDRPQTAHWLDSASYQATTRGGRKVDAFLQGKAVFKDVSLISGQILLDIADSVAYQERWDRDGDSSSELATALYLIGGALFVAGAVANPAADVRAWELMPEAWFLVAEDLKPGQHVLQVEGRAYALSVPARGQTVALVPRLTPGGPRQLGTE
jgi:hypothetical protein